MMAQLIWPCDLLHAQHQMHTQVKLSAIVVGMHSAAEALLEALPLVHHGNADRGLGRLLRARLLQALALCHAGVHHATVSEVQALALHEVLQKNTRFSEAYFVMQQCARGQGESAVRAMGRLSRYLAYHGTPLVLKVTDCVPWHLRSLP